MVKISYFSKFQNIKRGKYFNNINDLGRNFDHKYDKKLFENNLFQKEKNEKSVYIYWI